MDGRVQISLSSSDASRVRRAFSCEKRADGGEGAAIELGDRGIVARKNGEDRIIDPSRVYKDPESPSISDDGSQVAIVMTSALSGRRAVEIISSDEQKWSAVRCLSTMGMEDDAVAADLAPDGHACACVSREDEVRVSSTYGHLDGREFNARLVDALGAAIGASDVEYLPGDRLAIETANGTYLLMNLDGTSSSIPLRSFDPDSWERRCQEAEKHLGALTPEERAGILDDFGLAAVAAHASPDGRVVLVQIRRDSEHVENLVLDRKSGQRASVGTSPLEPPDWSATTVSLPHGSTSRLSTLFPFSGFYEAETATAQGGVLQEPAAVILNGVRVGRRVSVP